MLRQAREQGRHLCREFSSRQARGKRFSRARFCALLVLSWAVAAAGCETAIVGAKCGEGFSRCGDECVNLKRDFRNCGECENLCGGFICLKGKCEQSEDEQDAAVGDVDSASD